MEQRGFWHPGRCSFGVNTIQPVRTWIFNVLPNPLRLLLGASWMRRARRSSFEHSVWMSFSHRVRCGSASCCKPACVLWGRLRMSQAVHLPTSAGRRPEKPMTTATRSASVQSRSENLIFGNMFVSSVQKFMDFHASAASLADARDFLNAFASCSNLGKKWRHKCSRN